MYYKIIDSDNNMIKEFYSLKELIIYTKVINDLDKKSLRVFVYNDNGKYSSCRYNSMSLYDFNKIIDYEG